MFFYVDFKNCFEVKKKIDFFLYIYFIKIKVFSKLFLKTISKKKKNCLNKLFLKINLYFDFIKTL